MISLKEWNSFDSKTREAILEISGHSVGIFNREYHHSFDYDSVGKTLKYILSCCYKQPNKTIKVCATIIPTYIQKTGTSKPVVKKQETPKTNLGGIIMEEKVKHCEYCGKEIEDTNDTGSLCYRCYMKEYYPNEQEYDYL